MNQVRRVFKYTGYDKLNGHLKLQTIILTPTWGRFKYGASYNWYNKYSR